jgi:hypothetical protein
MWYLGSYEKNSELLLALILYIIDIGQKAREI